MTAVPHLRGSPGYPARVASCAGAPPALWVVGVWPSKEGVRRVAIVGARAATRRAVEQARSMARCLASDCEIVSGGALGVDGAAHEGALDAGGRTLVVLGTGIDVAYPVRHAPLFERVRAHGALLSPFAPGTPPRPGHFPARNRVIAALADVVVVVEASIVSGSMGTARMAREAGRLVAAVPGSPGTDHLLAEGAHGVVSAEDVRALLDGRPVEGTRRPDARSLDGTARSLYEALGPSPMDLGELASRARLSIAVCAATVVELEAGGFAARATGGRYQRLS